MASFETHLKNATSGENPDVLGAVALAVDRDGKTILSHATGKTHLSPTSAQPITTSSVFVLASATKLLTVVTLLRLVQSNSNISLDDPNIIATHLPELCNQDVITSSPGAPLTLEARKRSITLRQLLTHTSGSGADILDPRLMQWRKEQGQAPMYLSAALPDAITTPFLFQPGEGWAYGAGLDWIALLISRITGEKFSDVVKREVCDVVRCDTLIGFHKREIEERGGCVVQVVSQAQDGHLEEYSVPEQKSERGGGGMFASAGNFIKVLAELVAGKSKLLGKEMLDKLFEPQLEEGSKALEALRGQSGVFKSMTGALTEGLQGTAVNHALGGLLIVEDRPELGKSAMTMAWGGAFGSMWFANREQGVAAFYGGSSFPPGQGGNAELMGEFVKEVWRAVAK